MNPPLPQISDAIEIPAGVFNVMVQTRYQAPALTWYVWELQATAGQSATLVALKDVYYLVEPAPALPWPETPTLTLGAATLPLMAQGEARVERTSATGHDFWLATYHLYGVAEQVVLLTRERGALTSLQATHLEAGALRLYRVTD